MPTPAEPIQPAGLDPAFGSYRPPVGDLEAAPIPVVLDAWYATYPDPGIQSIFRAGATAVERVFGPDDRWRVSNTRIEPFRRIAMLEITASDGSRWRGIGWLVSRYLMVTAGHCVYMANRGGWVSSIRVRFGANGDDNGNLTAEAAPHVTATDFRSVLVFHVFASAAEFEREIIEEGIWQGFVPTAAICV